MVVISSGIMIAVPEAWTTRAPSSIPKLGDAAASSVPAENRPMASRKTPRVLKRCSRNPVAGMTTAMVSMKIVASHWMASSLTLNSCISTGRATFMIVSLRITMKAEMISTVMVARSLGLSRVLVSVTKCGLFHEVFGFW